MKKIFRNLKTKTFITSLLIFFCIILGGVVFFQRLKRDHTPPIISFDEESVILTEDEVSDVLRKDYSCLLSGVNAYDDKDGDISDRVIVYSVNTYEDNTFAIINYRVLDKNNNMAAEQRIAYLKKPAQIYNDLLISVSGKMVGYMNEWSAGENGSYEEAAERPVIEMESTVNLVAGEDFEPQDYLISLNDDQDSFETLLQNCRMEGEYDLHTPGIYPLAFYVTDSDGNESDPAVLVLIVGMNVTNE